MVKTDMMKHYMSFLWHKADAVLPEKDGNYVVITKSEFNKFGRIITLPFYVESGKFNSLRGSDIDTSIDVLYWADVCELLPAELKEEN